MSLTLAAAVGKLARLYSIPEPPEDPVEILVGENIGYLIDDERRAELFAEFRKRIGLKPAEIANAPMKVLTDIARRGGMAPQKRAERIREIGSLLISECDGNLPGALRELPLPKARSLLKKFPSVGDPGADRILLFAGIAAQPALDSNGLRTLIRLGFCEEQKSYGPTYKGGVEALREACPQKKGALDAQWLKRAYSVLREHGKALCKRSAPHCEPCPLDAACAHRLTKL